MERNEGTRGTEGPARAALLNDKENTMAKNKMVEAETVRVQKYTVERFRQEVRYVQGREEEALKDVRAEFIKDVGSDGIAYAMKWADQKVQDETKAVTLLWVCKDLLEKDEVNPEPPIDSCVRILQSHEARVTDELLHGGNSWANDGDVGIQKAKGIRWAIAAVQSLLGLAKKVIEAQEAGKPDEKAI